MLEALEKESIPEGTEPIDVLKPYPQEHACRISDPDQYSEFRRGSREHEGKRYSVIYGNKDGTWEQQAFRYNKDSWTAGEARTHCNSHDGSFEAAARSYTQEELMDEIDYLKDMIDEVGLSDEAMEKISEIYVDKMLEDEEPVNEEEIKELTQNIIDTTNATESNNLAWFSSDGTNWVRMEEIKSGATLNKKNVNRLEQIMQLAQEILDSNERELPGDTGIEDEKEIDKPSIEEILNAIHEIK